jgi:intracellular septation protein
VTKKPISAGVKLALELGPIVLFFIGYIRLKERAFTIGGTQYDGFILVTAAFIPLVLLSTGLLWWLTGKLSKMQIVTAVLVVIFGGLSVGLNDERFIKMKPTMIYLVFGGILAVGMMRGQSYLQYVMEEAMPLTQEGWMILTRRIMAVFFVMAAANEIVWRFFSTDTWVNFKTFVLPVVLFAFFITQGRLFETYGQKDDD